MDDAIWIFSQLEPYVWPTPGPPKNMNIAGTVLTLSWTMLFEIVCKIRMDHCRTNQTYDYSWDGAYIVMDETIWSRLNMYVWAIPGRYKSMIIAETALTLSWTMLFGIVCKRTHASTTPEPSTSMIIAETVLALSWVMLYDIVREHTHQPRPIKPWMMLFEIVCKRIRDPLHDQQNLWL